MHPRAEVRIFELDLAARHDTLSAQSIFEQALVRVMKKRIRIGILGYGNLGRGAIRAIEASPDLMLQGVYTRRDPATVSDRGELPFFRVNALDAHKAEIDVLLLCGGSATDLPTQGPDLAGRFVTVDSYDTHARIPEYFESVDAAARAGDSLAIISTGWDPGLFSLHRMLGEAILPAGETYTFWGRGLSQGHSDALRRIPGVKAGVQYTIPSEESLDAIRAGARPSLSVAERHKRECFVVAEDGADPEALRQTIVNLPHYFADYETKVHFIDEETLARDHAKMPHGGVVLRSATTSSGINQIVEFKIALDSNPEFTGAVLVAYARAAHRLFERGVRGALTPFDVAPGLLSPRSGEELRRELL